MYFEPEDWRLISFDGSTAVIEIEEPEPCRYFYQEYGEPAACCLSGDPVYMEDFYINDPTVICSHCQAYCAVYEKTENVFASQTRG